MAKKPQRPRDPNQLARLIVDIATGEAREAQETTFTKRASKAGTKGSVADATMVAPIAIAQPALEPLK